MTFVSTVGTAPPVDLPTAVRTGLAPDGGLYLPSVLGPLGEGQLAQLEGCSFAESAARLLPHLIGPSLAPDVVARICRVAFDFPVPTVQLSERVFVLELFHGPTLAFKDVGARFLAQLLAATTAPGVPLTVLAATSGDTGGAVAAAFHGLPGTRIVILYPHGQVSALQERQFATLGGNVEAVAVEGVFDDCQRLVKGAFADGDLRRRLGLTSANSINVGRLLPQVVYYFHALAQLRPTAPDVVVSVPSGNFGNLTAGLIAKRLGLPVGRFVAATNANDIVPEYLRTGQLRTRLSVRTVSNAMDVGDPSNLERIVTLYEGDLDRLRHDISGRAFTDEQTIACIAETSERYDYVLDPHSAVGLLGVEAELAEGTATVGITLATAHAAKFPDVVGPAIGGPVEAPARLAGLEGRRSHARRMAPSLEALRVLLDRD
jgi:threonine synthase